MRLRLWESMIKIKTEHAERVKKQEFGIVWDGFVDTTAVLVLVSIVTSRFLKVVWVVCRLSKTSLLVAKLKG